jgi:hypothetical protein
MWVLRQCARILGVGVRRVLNTTRRDLLILAMSCQAITLKFPTLQLDTELTYRDHG